MGLTASAKTRRHNKDGPRRCGALLSAFHSCCVLLQEFCRYVLPDPAQQGGGQPGVPG